MTNKSISVQEIKGRFEQLQDVAICNNTTKNENSGASSSFSTFSKNLNNDNPSTYTKDIGIKSHSSKYSKDIDVSRAENENSKSEKEVRTGISRRNVDLNGNKYSDLNYSSNFSSFAEKQKLVENIVKNIKTSTELNKKEKLEKTKPKNPFDFTSKLEKDIKNIIEKGVRKGSNSKESHILSGHTKENNLRIKSNDVKIEENDVKPKIVENFSTLDKSNDKDKMRNNSYPNIHSKRIKSYIYEEVDDHKYISDDETEPQFKQYRKNQFSEPPELFYKSVQIPSPVRPPRRRKKDNLASSHSFYDNFPFIQNDKFDSYNEYEDVDTVEKRSDYRSLPYLTDDSYFANCDTNQRYSTSSDIGILGYSTIHIENREDQIDNCSFNASMTPPKKPPRTFAHDIYKSLQAKTLHSSFDNLEAKPPVKLSQSEIDKLYTKPIKRTKPKPLTPTQSNPIHRTNNTLPIKPAIAPKPPNLRKSHHRLSVTEPLPSYTEAREIDCQKQKLKRNSSLRQSLKKPIELATSLTRKESPIRRRLRSVTEAVKPKKSSKMKYQVNSSGDVGRESRDEGGPVYDVPNHKKYDKSHQNGPEELHYMCSPLFEKTAENTKVRFSEDAPKTQKEEKENVQNFHEKLHFFDNLKKEFRQSCKTVQRKFNDIPKRGR